MHQAISWRFEIHGRQMEFKEQNSQFLEMERLAVQVNDPDYGCNTIVTQLGTQIFYSASATILLKYMAEMSKWQMQVKSRYLDVTLVRPRIEFLFEQSRNEEAIELVRRKYVSLYSRHCDEYYYKLLQAWSKDYGFALSVPPQNLNLSVVLRFLPRI